MMPFSCVWGFESCVEDLDGDDLVGVADILMLLSAFGAICP